MKFEYEVGKLKGVYALQAKKRRWCSFSVFILFFYCFFFFSFFFFFFLFLVSYLFFQCLIV